MRVDRRWVVAALLVALLAGCSQRTRDAGPWSPSEADIAANNRGVALMGRFDYPAAQQLFTELAAQRPQWRAARLNLAVATLNRQGEGDDGAALTLVEGVLTEAPDDLRAHYLAGVITYYRGDAEAALAHFRRVAEADPADGYAAYFVGQALAQLGRLDEAVEWQRRAIAADPFLISAYYAAAQTLLRAGRGDEAQGLLDDYTQLRQNPRARLVELKYTRMGPRAEAEAVGVPQPKVAPVPQGPVFSAPRVVAQVAPAAGRPSLTTVDLDGDGLQDLFLAGAVMEPGEVNTILRGDGSGGFTPVADHPLRSIPEIRAALWGDLDDDGLVDLYLCRKGPNQLWRQVSSGRWERVTGNTEIADHDRECVDGALIDADHDGDLDIFLVNADGPNELLNNDRNGRFRPLAETHRLAGSGARGRGVIATDLDSDRDVDLVVIKERPPHEVYENGRMWRYHEGSGYDRLVRREIAAAAAGDADGDGRVELYLLAPDGGLSVWRPDRTGEWLPTPLVAADGSALGGGELALQDLDGDLWPELIHIARHGIVAYRLDPAGAMPLFKIDGPVTTAIPVIRDPARGPSLIGLAGDGGRDLTEWPPGPGRHPFTALALTGKEDRAATMRSNASGIGAQVVVRVGSAWAVTGTFDSCSAPGQSLQPVALGLGGAAAADSVAIRWSDGVLQTELAVTAGERHVIAEVQRQLSSCPVLFAWDGERFRFVSDLLGVGGIGFLVTPGVYAPPRPWEFFHLPLGLAQPRDGAYDIKITEPMEEVAYLDGAALHVYDLPPGWSMVMDERMGTGAPEPTGRPIFFRDAEELAAARRESRGVVADVTAVVATADGHAVEPAPRDRRFIGLLQRVLAVTLEFAAPIDRDGRRPVLVADGWVEYPYSQTVFAAWQADASYTPVTLEAMGADGKWRTVYATFGYPAGMPREMALPLDRLPAGTRRLRLRSNMEIYWDRLRIVYEEPLPAARHRVVMAAEARVAKVGYPRRSTGPQSRPHYDYDVRSPFDDTRYLAGGYTRLGRIDPLVAEMDGALAIIGPGEEIGLRFPAPAPMLAGWTRHLVLEARGYAKDMDLYTADGDTVGPLPVPEGLGAGLIARRDALHREYNTRFQVGP